MRILIYQGEAISEYYQSYRNSLRGIISMRLPRRGYATPRNDIIIVFCFQISVYFLWQSGLALTPLFLSLRGAQRRGNLVPSGQDLPFVAVRACPDANNHVRSGQAPTRTKKRGIIYLVFDRIH